MIDWLIVVGFICSLSGRTTPQIGGGASENQEVVKTGASVLSFAGSFSGFSHTTAFSESKG